MKHNLSTFIEKDNKRILKEQGNIKIDALYQIITNKKGQPDHLAIDLYTEARSWFKPKKTAVNGNVIYLSKLKGYGWQIGYEYFAEKYKCSKDKIRTKFVLLEKLGLLTRNFRTEYFFGQRFNNLMYLLVWKDTPHFYSEVGLEKPTIACAENQGYLCENSRTPILEFKDNIYVIPNNKEIERDIPKDISSISKKEKILKKKSPESESLEKSSLGDDFLTLPNPPEPILDEDNEMKAQIIPLKPERNTQFELNQAIFKTFGTGIAEELIQRCQFILEPNRIGIKVGQGLTLSDTDKKKLRSCIYDTYGKNIKIVSLNQAANELPKEVDLQSKVEEPTLSEIPKNESCLLWQKFQMSLNGYFPQEIAKHAMTAWFSKLKATQILSANKLILTGSDFYIDYIFRQFEAAIEHIAKTNKITVELHFESKSSKPIIFTPKGRI